MINQSIRLNLVSVFFFLTYATHPTHESQQFYCPITTQKNKNTSSPIKQFSISILKMYPFHALTPSKCFVYSHALCQE